MVTPWRTQVNPVVDGEEVRARITNRYPDQLKDRTQNLKDRLDAIEEGQGIYLRNVALSSSTQVGTLVYWDAVLEEYKPALAATQYDLLTGEWSIAASSFAVGIVIQKAGSTMGDLFLFGYLPDFDFTNTIGTSGATQSEAGAYYLSGTNAGKAVKQKPAVGVFVMYLRGDGSAHIQPSPRDVIESHIHYKFDLYSAPAGTVVCTDPHSKYTFDTVNPALPGWLPASDPALGGSPPPGAVFGYNMAAHPELSRIWPPQPIDSVYVEMDGKGVEDSAYLIDYRTIWWMNDCYGKAPWSPEIIPCGGEPSSSSFSSSLSSSSSSSSSSHPVFRECNSGSLLEQMGYQRGDPFNRRMAVWFVKMVAKTNSAVVTRLRALPGNPVRIVGCDGITPAQTGDLQIGVDLALGMQENEPGYLALKRISGSTFYRGPIVEAVKAGSNIIILPVSGAGEIDAEGYVKGRAVISANIPGSDQQEAGVILVALDKVREEQINDLFILVFPQSVNASFRGKIDVPLNLTIPSPKMELWFWILARVAGTLPQLPIGYRRLPKPMPTACTPVVLPSSDTALANLNPGLCSFVSANRYVQVASDPFTIVAGDQIQFNLQRLGATDGYAGDAGIVRMGCRIFAGV